MGSKRERHAAKTAAREAAMQKLETENVPQQPPIPTIDPTLGVPWCSGVGCPHYLQEKQRCRMIPEHAYRLNFNTVKSDVVCLPVVHELVVFYHNNAVQEVAAEGTGAEGVQTDLFEPGDSDNLN